MSNVKLQMEAPIPGYAAVDRSDGRYWPDETPTRGRVSAFSITNFQSSTDAGPLCG
jgi:hypothetical protein